MTPAAVPDVVPSPAELVERLAAARILPAERGWDFLAVYLAETPCGNGVGFIPYLVRQRALTEFQSDRISAGEWNRLTMGPYVLREPIGGGTLGTLYRGEHRDTGRGYAVNVLPLRSMWHFHLAKKLVRMFADIPEHVAVVPLADLDTANGFHYLAWPYEPGETLARYVERKGPLPVAEGLRVAVAVGEALSFCHRHGISHGCLSPSTVLLGPDGRVKVTEWGIGALLSENLADDESFLDTISSATAVSQNLDCVPPETIAEPTRRTIAGDQYAFGCTLYAAFTGSCPFPEGNLVDKMIAHQTREPARVRSRNVRVPESVSTVVAKLLQKAPADRYTGWGEPIAALRAAATELTSSPKTPAERPAAEREKVDAPTTGMVETESVPLFIGRLADPLSARPPVSRTVRTHSESEVTFELGDGDEETDNSYGVLAGRPRVGSTGEIPAIEVPASKPETPPPSSNVRPIILKGRTSTPIQKCERSEGPSGTNSIPATGLTRTKFNFNLPNPVALGEMMTGTERAAAPARFAPPTQRAGFWKWLKSKLFGTPIPEVLQISLFGPSRVAAGQTIRLQSFAHPPVTFESIKTLARAFVADADLLASGYADRLVPRGASLAFHLSVANAGVAEPYVSFVWAGQPLPKTFDVHVPWESQTGVTSAVLSTAVGPDRTAVMSFRLTVMARASSNVGSGILSGG